MHRALDDHRAPSLHECSAFGAAAASLTSQRSTSPRQVALVADVAAPLEHAHRGGARDDPRARACSSVGAVVAERDRARRADGAVRVLRDLRPRRRRTRRSPPASIAATSSANSYRRGPRVPAARSRARRGRAPATPLRAAARRRRVSSPAQMRSITSRPVAVEQAHDVHALGVAEARVELDHLDAVGGREEAAVHDAAEMPPLRRQPRDHPLDDRARLLVVLARHERERRAGHRQRAHAARAGSLVAVVADTGSRRSTFGNTTVRPSLIAWIVNSAPTIFSSISTDSPLLRAGRAGCSRSRAPRRGWPGAAPSP